MAWIAPVAMGVASLVGNWISANKQRKENKALAAFQSQANEEFQDRQNAYNTPAAQMARFGDAGLNPHLIYGQGNPGSQSQPLKYPDIGRADFQRMFQDVLPMVNQTSLIQSQVQATNAKTVQVGVLADLQRMQTRVLAANPMLNAEALGAIIEGLKSTASIKASEAGIKGNELFVSQETKHQQVGIIFRELELLDQRFRLGQADQKIKAEVLQSKEFQNAILEVQKKFMTNAEFTPQHIFQFIQLLLMKLL